MDQSRIEELFPTLSRVPGLVRRVWRRAFAPILPLLRRFARRAWKPAVIAVAAVALLHTAAVLITGKLVRNEIVKLRALGYPTREADLLADSRQAGLGAEKTRQRAERLLRAMELRTKYDGCDEWALSKFDEPISAKQWQIAQNQMCRLKSIIDAAADIDWRRAGATTRDAEQADRFAWRLWELHTTLRACAAVAARSGDAEYVLLVLRTTERVEQCPALNRFGCGEITAATRMRELIMRITSLVLLSEAQLKEMYASARHLHRGALQRDRIGKELLQMLSNYDELRGYGYPNAFADYCDNNEGRPFWDERVKGYWQSPYINLNEIVSLGEFRRHRHQAEKPYRELATKRQTSIYSNDIEFVSPPPVLPKWAFFAEFLHAEIGNLARLRDHTIALAEGNRLYLAVVAHKAGFGDYPDMLSDIERLGWANVAVDPFSGREFCYERRGKGFVLYSIGTDLKDNVGRPVKNGDFWEDKDIVWYDPATVRRIQAEKAEELRKHPLPPLPPLPPGPEGM